MRHKQREEVYVACVDYRLGPILDARNEENRLRGVQSLNVRDVTGSLTAATETLRYIMKVNSNPGIKFNMITHVDCKGGQLVVDAQNGNEKIHVKDDERLVYVAPFDGYALKSIEDFERTAVAVRIASAFKIGIPPRDLSAALIGVPRSSPGTNILAIMPPSDIMYSHLGEEARINGPEFRVHVTQMYYRGEILRDAGLAIRMLNPDRVVVLTSERGGTLLTETIAPDIRELEKVLRSSELYMGSEEAVRDIRR